MSVIGKFHQLEGTPSILYKKLPEGDRAFLVIEDVVVEITELMRGCAKYDTLCNEKRVQVQVFEL